MSTTNNNAHVTAKEIINVFDTKQTYVIIETPRGKAVISIGEKNFTKLQEILQPLQAQANPSNNKL